MLRKRKRYFGVKRKSAVDAINDQIDQEIDDIDNDGSLTDEEKTEKKDKAEKKRKAKKKRSEKRMQRMK
jgi:hypothetical protein